MNDEPGRIFEHQNLSSELIGFTRLTAFVKLCVRLEHAEQFITVGDRLAEQHASPCGVHHAFCASDERLQRVRSEDVVFGCVWQEHGRTQLACPLGNLLRFLQKKPYGFFIRAT